jgi:zinc/manganese transport system substrate-binding protein
MDPENVIIWTRNISAALGEFDNKNATIYVSRADDFISKLNELDQWIREQVMQVQTKNRLLVTDHAVLGYFAARYGFTLEGEIIQSFSSDASPTARGLVALEDKIRLMGVKAIFVSETANIKLAEQVAEDLGIRAVRIYHAGIPTSSAVSSAYLELMRYNVSAIVEALK